VRNFPVLHSFEKAKKSHPILVELVMVSVNDCSDSPSRLTIEHCHIQLHLSMTVKRMMSW